MSEEPQEIVEESGLTRLLSSLLSSSNEEEETPSTGALENDMGETEIVLRKVDEISRSVRLLEKFQWVTTGIGTAFLLLGGYIWFGVNSQVRDMNLSIKDISRIEILMEDLSKREDSVEVQAKDQDRKQIGDEARLDQLEKDLVRLQSEVSSGKR